MAITLVGSSGNSGSANFGASFSITVSTGAVQSGDLILVSYAVPRSITMAVLSSGGTPYSQIGTTISQGNCFQSCWYRVATSSETIAVCSGTGNFNDAAAATSLVFRGFDPSVTISQNSTTGNGLTPDSPAVTVVQANDAVITTAAVAVANTMTAPSSFQNQISKSQSASNPMSNAMAWITSSVSGSFDPDPWSLVLFGGDWTAFSITLKSTDVVTTPFFEMTPSVESLPPRLRPSGYSARPTETYISDFSTAPFPGFGWYSALASRPQEALPIYPSRYGITPLFDASSAARSDPFFDGWYRDLIHRPKVEKESLHPSQQNGTAFPYYFGVGDSTSFGWFASFSMPVMAAPPLGPWRVPFFTVGIGFAEYSFNLTETGDTASFAMSVASVQHRAQVAITEEGIYPAEVTIQEIRYTRKYS